MDQNAENAADKLQRHATPEVSVTCQSLAELMVQALVADQSGLSTPQYRDRVLKSPGGIPYGRDGDARRKFWI